MARNLDYTVKEHLVSLSGACFWYWGGFFSFLDSCGVKKAFYQKYPKESHNKYQVMRNVIGDLESIDDRDTLNNIISSFYKMKKAADKDIPDPDKAKQLLAEFHEMIGSDPIEKEIERRKKEESQKKYTANVTSAQTKNKRLEDLSILFNSLLISTDLTPQKKGYKLEDIFCDLLGLNEIEHSPPYRHPGEQIDGHFKFERFDYLIEAKWEKDAATQADLSVFDGKIRGKAQSTRGLFLAINGFDDNAIRKYSGESPRIILMTGEDLALILSARILFYDAMAAKVSAIVKHGNIHLPIRSIL